MHIAGVDIFGRGCLGGGGWNTVEALAVIRSVAASAALFAPGWVYEKFPKEEFVDNYYKLTFSLVLSNVSGRKSQRRRSEMNHT